MTPDDDATRPTSAAVAALMRLDEHGRDLCPDGSDPAQWSDGVLYDLTRIAELLDSAVERVSTRTNDTIAQQAHALATVIAAHRNLETRSRPE